MLTRNGKNNKRFLLYETLLESYDLRDYKSSELQNMRRSAIFCVLMLAVAITHLRAQYVFPEKFEHCYLDEFKFEETALVAEVDDDLLKAAITTGWDSKMLKGVAGNLGLQILVDRKGVSCLMSVRNNTNLKLKKMNLEENINTILKWKGQSDKISAIVVLEFDKGEISLKRFGTTDMRTLTEIKN